MAEDKRYNGWTNYETWNVKLWMDNDEGSYGYWQERTEDVWNEADHDKDDAIRNLADELEASHKDNAPELQGTYGDLLGAALSEVNWYEIAESLLDDYREANPDEETEEVTAE